MIIGIDASRAVTARRTGTEAYAYHLIKTLIPLTSKRHQLRLYFNQDPGSLFDFPPHVEPVVIPFKRLWTHLRLAAELHHRAPDVFFTPAHVIPLTYHRPSVATIHDVGYRVFPEAHPWGQRRYLEWSTRHNAKRSDHILADSAATKADIVRYYHIPASKIEVVYPGLDPQLVAERQELTLTKPTIPYLFFLSTIQPRKNVARLILAFASIADQIPHQLVLGGRWGWQAAEIRDTLEQLPAEIRARIDLLGYVPDNEKVKWISEADVLLYPSLYEGFGFPLLEGNACGTPVLAGRSSSLIELAGAEDTPAAHLVDPHHTEAIATGIRRLIEDHDLRQKLISQGLANIERFQWKQTATQTLAILEAAGGAHV